MKSNPKLPLLLSAIALFGLSGGAFSQEDKAPAPKKKKPKTDKIRSLMKQLVTEFEGGLRVEAEAVRKARPAEERPLPWTTRANRVSKPWCPR